MSETFARIDALGQADLVKSGQVSARELVAAAIDRIQRFDSSLNSVVSPDFDRAVQRASARLPDGPFQGVPYLVKDLVDYAGLINSRGSRLLKQALVRRTAEPILRAERAGLVVIAKSNTSEFGLMATTESLLLGPCRNPWDLSRSAGGSSGGAAAAVAAGLVPIAHATDGGGSIRMPASCCGLFGLKLSRDRLTLPAEDEPHPLGTHFGLTRSVRDSAALLAVSENKHPTAALPPVGRITAPSTERRRIGFHTRSFAGNAPHRDVVMAIDATAKLCEELGHIVVEAAPPLNGREFWHHFKIIWGGVPALRVGQAKARGLAPEEVLEPWTLGLAEHHRLQSAETIAAAHAYIDQVREEMSQWFADYDLMLCPVLSEPPVALGEFDQTKPFEEQWDRLERYVAYTAQQNAAGVPAMSIPLGWSSDGLPIGSQFTANFGRERMLLELAYELERAQSWANRWPPHAAR